MLGFDMRHAAGGRQRGGGRLGEQVNEQRLVCGDTGTEPGSLDSPDEYGARSTYTLPWNLLAAKRTVLYCTVQQPASMLLSSCPRSLWGPPATASAEEQLDANNAGRVVDHMAPNHIIRTCTAFLTFAIGWPLLSFFL